MEKTQSILIVDAETDFLEWSARFGELKPHIAKIKEWMPMAALGL